MSSEIVWVEGLGGDWRQLSDLLWLISVKRGCPVLQESPPPFWDWATINEHSSSSPAMSSLWEKSRNNMNEFNAWEEIKPAAFDVNERDVPKLSEDRLRGIWAFFSHVKERHHLSHTERVQLQGCTLSDPNPPPPLRGFCISKEPPLAFAAPAPGLKIAFAVIYRSCRKSRMDLSSGKGCYGERSPLGFYSPPPPPPLDSGKQLAVHETHKATFRRVNCGVKPRTARFEGELKSTRLTSSAALSMNSSEIPWWNSTCC